MAQYKLVIVKVAPDFATGQELKDILVTNNFSIPQIKYEPERPPQQPDLTLYPQSTMAGQIKWREYGKALSIIRAENKVIKAKFKLDMLHLTNRLEEIFLIATYVHVGQNPDGTKKWDYRLVADPIYKFSQCASRLTKLPSNQVIDFICFKYFG